MGPTASGKTDTALRLAGHFPLELISVDSALVYRGMDIGTAKPDRATRARVPHHLIDIREPEEAYSAGRFVRDALAAIADCRARGRVPLLVGGTMMYFRALTAGIARLPEADAATRAALDAEAARDGWPTLHRQLSAIDPGAAARINENDSQRIQRALEVYRVSGRVLSDWQAGTAAPAGSDFLKIALLPASREEIHRRIERRLDAMLAAGFVDEVARLRARPGLSADSPAMRAVGYRQLWAHLAGECDLATATGRALAATRQLAKRQITWLRSEQRLAVFDPLDTRSFDTISSTLQRQLDK
ncbi:MAG TPA: tRNA (adenosine(37)-N6)-dimethylallyltransferase MiaA [Woeseiaceae bacterium]|nr:tRNA (adenosine(37)-N6)-dimethylallyltransferase MiaA [Woeseiaceae bacterium]